LLPSPLEHSAEKHAKREQLFLNHCTKTNGIPGEEEDDNENRNLKLK
jgi:hypothetical protein